MPALGLLNYLMIQSSTFLICGTVQNCVRVKICFLLVFFSCCHLLNECNSKLVVLLYNFYVCFVSNPYVGPNAPRKHTKLPFQYVFPLTHNFLTHLCFTPCALTRCDFLFLPLILMKCIRDNWFQVLV